MGFDAQAFATSFLTDQAQTWKERWRKAEEESMRKLEIAQTAGAKQYQKRKALHARYKDIMQQLKAKGMSSENLAAIATNPAEMATVYNSLTEFESAHGRSMSPDNINKLITLSKDYAPDVDENGRKLTWQDNIKRSAGLYKDNYKPDDPDDEGNMWQSIMGINAQERENQKLRERKEIDGYSAYELYQMGTTGDYLPDNQASFTINRGMLPDPMTASENLVQAEMFYKNMATSAQSSYNSMTKRMQDAVKTKPNYYMIGDRVWDYDKLRTDGVINKHEAKVHNILDTWTNTGGIAATIENRNVPTEVMDAYGVDAMMNIASQYAAAGQPDLWQYNPQLRGTGIVDQVKQYMDGSKNAKLTITSTNEAEVDKIVLEAMQKGELVDGDSVFMDVPNGKEFIPITQDMIDQANASADEEDAIQGLGDLAKIEDITFDIGVGEGQPEPKTEEELAEIREEEKEVELLETPKSNLTSIFNRAEPVSSAKSARIKMPDLSDVEKASISEHVEVLKKEYEYYRENSPSSSGTRKGIKYKGTSYFGFDRFLRAKLIEEYPNIDVRILGQFAKNYGK
tara:strand:- start:1636 stop:3342 length:1707 start_codon:yes stop_codon:yes gene_type:complete